MAPRIVEGVYRDGRIEVPERPEGVADGDRVRLILLGVDRQEADVREHLRREAFVQMRRGLDFGGGPHPTREEIYGERLRRFDRPSG